MLATCIRWGTTITALLVSTVQADDKVEWLRQNATAVRSLSIADSDFSDLMPLADKIGDSRVVMLGEASHGDGKSYEAKARLVRFLHERMGFDVLVWESGLNDCRIFDAALASDMPMDDVAKRGVFGIWTQTTEVRALMNYARKTKSTTRPLVMAGMDCQFSSKANMPAFPDEVFAFFDRVDPVLISPEDRKVLIEAVQWINANNYKEESEVCRKLVALARRLMDATRDPRFVNFHGERETQFMHRVLYNLIELERVNTATETIAGRHIAGLNIRNKAMGDNIVWFLRHYYPGRKLMVWAASSHLARNGGTVAPVNFPNMNTWLITGRETGDTVLAELGSREVYSIGFSSYDYYGGKAHEGSLEDFCHQTGKEYLLIDLKHQPLDHWLRTPLETSLDGLPMTADWSRIFDAVFFIDTMTASTKIPQSLDKSSTKATGSTGLTR